MQNTQPKFYPLRARIARQIIQLWSFSRGRDRTYLVLRSALRIPRKVTVDITPSVNINLDLDDYLQRWIFCHRLEDEPDYSLLEKILHKGDYFLDIGANIGITSLLASGRIGSEGRVYAVEALPATQKLLAENLALNEASNIQIVPFALLDKNTKVEFYGSTNGNIGGSSLSEQGQKADAVTVQGKTLDSLLLDGTIKRCDVMKIDIEGAEFLALQGMREFFTRSKPRVIMIEVYEMLLAQFSAKPSDIINFFANHGYVWYRASRNGLELLENLDIKGNNDLWAVLPDSIDRGLLL